MDNVDALACLWTRSVADDTLSVDGLLLGWANADTSTVVLEQMLGTRFDAGGAISVLAFRVRFPRVRDRIVALHCRTFLLADAIVEEISASLSKSQQEKEELDDDVTKSQMTHKPKRPTHGPIRILSIPF